MAVYLDHAATSFPKPPRVYERLREYLERYGGCPGRAEMTRQLLEWNGGGANSSGIGIANIDSFGGVHPDQFWQTHTLGNVRERPFGEIWTDTSDPLLAAGHRRSVGVGPGVLSD